MKKTLLLITILISINSNSQNFKAKISYNVSNVIIDSTKIQDLKDDPNNKKAFDLFEKLNLISKDFKLELVINNEKSFFSNTSKPLQMDSNTGFIYSFAETAYRVNDKFYFNKKDNELTIEAEKFGEKLLISKKPSKKNWEYLNITKKIGAYLCYQALLTYEYTSLKGETESVKQIVWYTMEIPIPFGPKSFVGFPGLVLEVIDGKVKYTATKIVLNPEEEFKIKKPTNGKKVTEEEFKKISDKSIENTKAIFKKQ